MKVSVMVALLVTQVACVKTFQVTATPDDPENAHYVIVKAGARGNQQVYDCLSMPDGSTWDPTCVEVDLTKKVPTVTRDVQPDVVWLVSPDEAALASMDLSTRGGSGDLSEGPSISVSAPLAGNTYSGAVPINVDFEPGTNGLAPNYDSMKVTYLRGWGIDITSRVQPYFTGHGFNYPEAPLYSGTHAVEIYIEDMEQNPSSKVITVTVE